MKHKLVFILLSVLLSACMTVSKDSPEIQNALKESRREVNRCLVNALSRLVQTTNDPKIMSEVAANRCQSTAYKEARKLKDLNTSPAYIEGYTGRMTNINELEAQALNILMYLVEEANK